LGALEDDRGYYELEDHVLGITMEALEKMRDYLQKDRI